MIINKSKIKVCIIELIIFVVSLLFLLGIRLWFPVCEVMGETVMACHWAGEILKALTVLSFVLSLVHIFLPNGSVKIGMDLSLIGLLVLTLYVPGNIVNICEMTDMSCRHYTLPWTIAFSVVLILLALADIVFYLALASTEKHKRMKSEG